MNFILLLITAIIAEAEGINPLENKPSKQTGVFLHHHASYANDGDPSTYSFTSYDISFWQADLQGYFRIFIVSVTSHPYIARYTDNALIGVSANDVLKCPNSEVITCGKWPGPSLGTFNFICNHTKPVRFVRVYREVHTEFLGLAEVSVVGTPINTLKVSEMMYERMTSKVLSAHSSSLTTENNMECARACFYGQPCIAFSFSDTADPNCLLGSGVFTTTSTVWSTYKVNDCSVNLC